MLFHSLQFLVFLPIVFALYWSFADKPTTRKVLLLVASAIFYAAWNPLPFLLVLYCATVDYFMALLMERTDDPKRRKLYVIISLVSNLGILTFFKYTKFLYDTMHWLLSQVGVEIVYHRFDILLPLGISFVVFQTLSYTIDVYRGDCEARKSWIDVALFISFFPQIIAGPIVRASHFLPQLDQRPTLSHEDGARAVLRVAKGLAKKILIADLLEADIVSLVFSQPDHYFPMEVNVGVFAYTLQIYYDFSAYSDVAIGAAAMFGYHIPENFNRPYKANNLPDFWRRWHISLSTWLRDYLYIPLGGNRHGKIMTIRNVMITMILGGIWHGANWRMALWGGMHGIGLTLTRLYWWRYGMPKKEDTKPAWMMFTGGWYILQNRINPHNQIHDGYRLFVQAFRTFIGWTLTFLSVMLARVFFRAPNMENAYAVLSGMLPAGKNFAGPNLTFRTMFVVIVATVIHFGPTNLYDRIADIYVKMPIWVRVLALIILVLVVKQVMNFEAQTFIYYQF